jgi:hypothetical protein
MISVNPLRRKIIPSVVMEGTPTKTVTTVHHSDERAREQPDDHRQPDRQSSAVAREVEDPVENA